MTLNRAVAVVQGARPGGGARHDRAARPSRSRGYFHFFGVKGALLMQLGRAEEARVAFDRAIALANTAAEAAHIRLHLDRLLLDLLMVQRNGRDHGGERGDHICGVESAAQADFHHS